MASNYALLLVPAKDKNGKTLIRVEKRHVKNVPGPKSEELAWDTTLDPEAYDDNVTLAAELARLITQGRKYSAVREAIVSNIGDAADIILDLKAGTPEISESSRHGLYEVAMNRLQAVAKAVGINL